MWAVGSNDTLNSTLRSGNFKASIFASYPIITTPNFIISYIFVNSTAVEFKLLNSLGGYAAIGFGGKKVLGTDITGCHYTEKGYECLDMTGIQDSVILDKT